MDAPAPRPAIAAIQPYRAGRPASDPALKLSSNENPFDPLPGVMAQASAALARANRYPDAGSTLLVDALADHWQVEPSSIAPGTGSVAVLYALVSAYCGAGDEVVYPWRSFEAYPLAVALSGATGVPVGLLPDGRHDLDAMVAAITSRTRVVLVCTPNNPTGPVLTAAELDSLVRAVPASILVVVDEAYAEFVRAEDAADGLSVQAEHANVVVLRTFSKAYGLAGLRVGYAVAHPDVAAAIRAGSAPFGVTEVAQAAAVASLAAGDDLDSRVEHIVQEREVMVEGLRGQGWDVPDPQGNFVWLPLGPDADDFAASCAPLTVRAFSGEGVRVTIGRPEVNADFLAAARRWRVGS